MKTISTLSKIAFAGFSVFVLAGLLLGFAMPGSAQTNSRSRARPGKHSTQTRLYPIAPSNWGGQSVSLTVERNSVKIEFDCAEAKIPQQLETDKKGNFSVNGTFTRHSPGPTRRDSPPQAEPARFEGKITGKSMKLKVTLVKTNEMLGEFSTERGKEPSLTRCY